MEYVSENVDSFLNFDREDVQGKSIYNIVHHGDHHRFSSYLLPPTLGRYSILRKQKLNSSFIFFIIFHQFFYLMNFFQRESFHKIYIFLIIKLIKFKL